MTDAPSRSGSYQKSSTILRLRAGLLLLIVFVALCGMGGHFLARQVGLGLGWSILLAVGIWLGVGIVLARIGSRLYFAIGALVTAFLAYLVYDFAHNALEWSGVVSLVMAMAATALVAFTFYDFRRLKHELRLWIYRR